jgi:hypothetical protein
MERFYRMTQHEAVYYFFQSQLQLLQCYSIIILNFNLKYFGFLFIREGAGPEPHLKIDKLTVRMMGVCSA